MSNLPKGWELKTLGELVSILTDYTANGSFASLKENVTYFNEPNFAALVRTTDLKKKEFKPERFTDKRGYEFLKKSALYGGEILMANVGSIGEVYIVPEVDFPMTLAPNMYLIKYNDNLINTYAYYFMNSSIFINQLLSKIASTTLQAVNKANFKSIKIPLPPLEEQKKIADILSTVDKKIAFVEENINATEELKKGLMQKLLTEGIGHTEFKETKIGKVPFSWEILKLVESISLMTDYVANGSFASLAENVNVYDEPNYAVYVRLFDLRKGLGHEAQKYVDEDSYKFLSKSSLAGNEILIANIGANVGEAFLMPIIDKPATLAPNMIEIKVDIEKLISEFLYFYLTSNIGLSELEKVTEGSGQPKINKTKLKTINVPLPPLKEQLQIIEILSTVDNKLENLKEKKQSFEELKKGLMQKLLTGEVRV